MARRRPANPMLNQHPLDPQTEWYTVEEAARMTVRDPSLIRRWIAVTKDIDPEHWTRSTKRGHALLLSPEALVTIVRMPRRPNRKKKTATP